MSCIIPRMPKTFPCLAIHNPYFVRFFQTLALMTGCLILVNGTPAQTSSATSSLPSETPAQLRPVTDSFEYERRDVMIAMRDGVKLHTVIIVPKGAKGAPILLTR